MSPGTGPEGKSKAVKSTLGRWTPRRRARSALTWEGLGQRSRRDRLDGATRLAGESLELRQLLSASAWQGVPSDEHVAAIVHSGELGAAEAVVQDTQFDIANFQLTLPSVLEGAQTFDMDGLRFYSGAEKVIQQNTTTFGSSGAPTWVLIGQIGPTFTPMLMTYGVTTLYSGTGFNDFVRWTDGLYTVANTLADKKDPNSFGMVFGGMQVQPLDGGFYVDSILNDGASYEIDNITNGVVKTQMPNTLTAGQQLQFADLVGASGIVNGTGYSVDEVVDPMTFTIKANDGHDLSQASATGGSVTTVASPSDDEGWGALVPNGQQMQLIDKGQRAAHSVFAGFTPTRMLISKTTDAVPQPLLQFAGVQTVGYKGGHLQAGVGFQGAGNAYYLQVDYLGFYKFVNANNSSDNEFVATISVGQNALTPRINTSGIVDGTVNTTGTPHGLADGDWIHFTSLNMPASGDGSPQPLTIGTSYQVHVLGPTSFQLIDPETNQPLVDPAINATAATAVKEIGVTSIAPEEIELADGTSVTQLVVTTSQPHNLAVGDPIVFAGLQLTTGEIPDQTYYVTALVGGNQDGTSTKFIFGDADGNDYNPLVPPVLLQGRVTAPLFKAGGVFLGGDATLKLSFDGAFRIGDWLKPTDFKLELSGSVSLFKDFGNGLAVGGVASLKGDNETSEGLVVQGVGGDFSVPAWGFNITGNITKSDPDTKQQSFNVALTGVSATSIRDDSGRETIAVNGNALVMVNSWRLSVDAILGHGQTNGLTIIHEADGTVWVSEASFTIVFDSLKPPIAENNTRFIEKLSIIGGAVDICWESSGPHSQDFEFGFGGKFSVAIGDPTPDANGNWKPGISTISVAVTPDLVKITSMGVHFSGTGSFALQVNGSFAIKYGENGEFPIIARDLYFKVTLADPAQGTHGSVVLSGGIILPELRNASIELGVDGSSGGLYVDTQTGKWQLNGWRIAIPSLLAGPFLIQNFVLGFTGSSSRTDPDSSTDFIVQGSGQMKLFEKGGLVIGVNFKLGREAGKFVVQDIGAAIRNLNPGLPIPATEAFLTDIAFDIDGIPGSVSFDLLLGAVMGDKITVGAKEYSLIQALISGSYQDRDIKVTGEVLIAGGTLGDITGALDLNWGTGTYTLNLSGKAFYDIFDATWYLYFSKEVDAGLFAGTVQVPDDIPIIGGLHVAEADMMYLVDHNPGGEKFLAAWFNFLDHFKYGVKVDFNDHAKVSLIGSKTIDGLQKELPGGTGSQIFKYNIQYTPSDAVASLQAAGLGAEDASSVSYGLIEVTWNAPDGQDEIAIAAGEGDAVVVWGPGAKVNAHGWVEDTASGISYLVLTDHSRPGDVLIHVAPTAAFTTDGASYDAPDLYVPLPNLDLNVVLQSNRSQDIDPAANWNGSFAAPAPEIQNLAVSQPQAASALGDDEDSPDPVTANNATVSFQWRGLDPLTTNVSLFFDLNDTGYKGTPLTVLSGDELTIGDPDADGWRTVTVPWDLGDLQPGVPLYVYSVIKDEQHAPVKTDYAGQVQSVPAAQIQVTYANGTNVSSAELQGLPLAVTPVKEFDVQSISAGVATVASAEGLSVGDTFMFHGLTSPAGVSNGTLYFVTSISGTTFTYSTTAGGTAVSGSSAGAGAAYVDQGTTSYYATDSKGLVSPHVDVFQTYRFAMAPTRGVFLGQPSGNQELSWVNELLEYNTFEGRNQLLRMQFEFEIQAAIAGTVYNDFEDNGQLDSFDNGLAGATVFLDDNNNGTLDLGEQSVTTGVDGAYLFVHDWSDADTPLSTYTTWVQVIPPAGYKVTSSPSIPPTGITFTNDGESQPALIPYDFMLASPIVLSGTAYSDANNNGVRDPGEKGIAGAIVTITPPSGGAIQVTTDAAGVWRTAAFARGNYTLDVDAPTGGTITTPTVAFTLGSPATINFSGPFDVTDHYSQSSVVSAWDPDAGQYHSWLLGMIDGVTAGSPAVNYVDLSGGASGDVSVLNTAILDVVPAKFDVFLGKWSSDGVPTPAISFIDSNTGQIAISPSTAVGQWIWSTIGDSFADERFALTYDPNRPDHSSLASIDPNGRVKLWSVDATLIGPEYQQFIAPGETLFNFSGGTPVKMVGFNMAGNDHYRSRDLAIAYLSKNYNVPQVAIWNHATGAVESFVAGGRALVDMITSDFDGDGREDIAVLTTDTSNQNYYLTVLLTQADGSLRVLRHQGPDLAVAADGTPLTNLASVRLFGGQQAILWSTLDGDSYLNAVTVTGEQLRITTIRAPFAGNIVALAPGDVGRAATFAVFAPGRTSGHKIGTYSGTIEVNIDGTFAVDAQLTKYGGTFSGYDVGMTGVVPAASTTASGIVFNDLNSNGFQDPGETGLPGLTVRLISPSGDLVTATSSDGSDGSAIGFYRFENVTAGSYLQIALPTGTWLAQNPPQGIDTNSNGSAGLLIGVDFTAGSVLATIPLDSPADDPHGVNIRSGDLQQTGRENLIIRTSDSLYVQYFGVDGSTSFTRFDVSSPAGYFRPELELADVNGDGRIDLVTSGQSGVDVFINIAFGQFRPFRGILADPLASTPNGGYSIDDTFTGDLDSGVTSAKTYTHALNFLGPVTTVNGVVFAAATESGANFRLEAIDSATGAIGNLGGVQNFSNNLQGAMNTLASSFHYSFGDSHGDERLTLTGLTAGVTYITTFYAVGYGAGSRQELVFDSLGGSTIFDENANGSGNGILLRRTYTATSDSITFTFVAQDSISSSFHQYALTNEVAPVGYTIAVPLDGDDDSDVVSGHRYTHAIDFAGDQSVTVAGVPLLQATTTGENFSLVSYDPVSHTTADNLDVFIGYENSLNGGLNSAASNFYYSPTGASQLTLTGLLVGATYTTTFFGVGFGSGVSRVSTVTDSLGGSVVIDENAFGDRQGFRFSRTFVATGDQITFTFVAADPNYGFHHYAVTNLLIDSNANYGLGPFSNDISSGISPSKTYTHQIDFNGTGTAVVNGLALVQTAAAGATYVLSALDPVTLSESSMAAGSGLENDLLGDFHSVGSDYFYSPTGASKLTLTGLTSGTTYAATFYVTGLGNPGTRYQSIADSLGGSFYVDLNIVGNGRGLLVRRIYTATSDTMTFWFMGNDPAAGFDFFALTNEVIPPQPALPNVFSTEIAVVPGGGASEPDRVLAVRQNTGVIYEIGWDKASAAPAATGKVYTTNHAIRRMEIGDVSAAGANDLAIYETYDEDTLAPLDNAESVSKQAVWLLSAASNYALGTLLIDLGANAYEPRVDLTIAPLFPGEETVLVLGNRSNSQTVDVFMARADSAVLKTSTPGFVGYGLNFGTFISGSSVPNVVIAGENAILVLVPGNDPSDSNNPTGFDPNVPLVEAGIALTGSTNAGAIGALAGAHHDELMVVQYLPGTGYVVRPYYNTTDSYGVTADAGGGLFDFAVVVPGTGGGTIAGNVFYDAEGGGVWNPDDYGISDGVRLYLDLNQNGTLDSTEPSTLPDRDGNYRFTDLMPRVYSVAIQLGSGYTATTATAQAVALAALPVSAVNGVDFGLKAKNFGVDLNNDHQADLLLTEPSSNGVYVQLRNGQNRLTTYKIGQLTSADWVVVGVYDLSSNATVDVLLHDTRTGQLRAWELFAGAGVPTVKRIHELGYTVPEGFSVIGVGDLDDDGTPELVMVRKTTGEHRIVEFTSDAPTESPLNVLPSSQVVGVGDLDGDGDTDLLLQNWRSNQVFARIYENGRFVAVKTIGDINPDWSVAGVTDLVTGGNAEVLFQERATGKAYAWLLGPNLTVQQTNEIDIGEHSGLRLHLSERFTSSISGTVFRDVRGDGGSADDTPLAGVTLKLYIDRNRNQRLDPTDGPPIATTETAADGTYVFAGQSAGNYLVQQATPDNFVPTGEPPTGALAVAVDEGATHSGVDFQDYQIEQIAIKNVYFRITHNGRTKRFAALDDNVQAGDTVKVVFTVPRNATATFSLVSYQVSRGTLFPPEPRDQEIYRSDTGTFGPGVHSLTVQVPNHRFEVDFVLGYPLEQFGKPGTNLNYADQRRLIASGQGEKHSFAHRDYWFSSLLDHDWHPTTHAHLAQSNTPDPAKSRSELPQLSQLGDADTAGLTAALDLARVMGSSRERSDVADLHALLGQALDSLAGVPQQKAQRVQAEPKAVVLKTSARRS